MGFSLKFKLVKFNLLFKCFLLASICADYSLASVKPNNVWNVVVTHFSLNHEVTQAAVRKQINWIAKNPAYIQKLADSKPYIYHIINEIKKRNLPGEIALLPMLESSFNPFAYSKAGAMGLWQLMPETGSDLGLKRDWWFDGRRSVHLSTDAALNYLNYLNKAFNGDWTLAFAAYDSGEGTIRRAIKKNIASRKKTHFWSLALPRETKDYIPRLFALAEVIAHPKRYNIKLPHIPHTPYFQVVELSSQIDLVHAAKLADLPYKEFIKLNPEFNRGTTAPDKRYKLLIPADKVKIFNKNLAYLPNKLRASWVRYKIHAGETIASIAKKYFISVKLLQEVNQLKHDKLGKQILVPNNKNFDILKDNKPKEKLIQNEEYKIIHVVQNGDTYEKLSRRYSVSVAELKLWNGTNVGNLLKNGNQLIIWKRSKKTSILT